MSLEASLTPFPTLEQAAALDGLLQRLERVHAVRFRYSTRGVGATGAFVLVVTASPGCDLDAVMRSLWEALAGIGLGPELAMTRAAGVPDIGPSHGLHS